MQAMIDNILTQRFQDLEIVVVGNATLYIKRAMLARPADERLRIIRTESPLSLSGSYNLAVRHSRGRFVKLLSPDAVLHPDYIAAQVNVLESNRGVALVASGTEYTDDAGEVVRRRRPFARSDGPYSARRVVKTIVRSGGNPIGPLTATMFRRADFRRCGAFTEDFPTSPELDLWIRLLRFGDFVYMTEPVSTVRGGNVAPIGWDALRRRLAERLEFTRQLAEDPTCHVSAADRSMGYLNCLFRGLGDAINHRTRFRDPTALADRNASRRSSHPSTLGKIGERVNA
jgi:glycosyltransferase involved in cell wall biosynthesis